MRTNNKTLDKVIGWFVVREDDEGPVPAEPKPAKAATSPATKATATASASTSTATSVTSTATSTGARESPRVLEGPGVAPGSAHDAKAFAEVYRASGIASEEQERVNRALELLRALPPGATLDVRRSIVEASMTAFGIPIDRILETAGGQLRALDAYAADGEKRTSEVLAQAEARIARLQAEIAEVQRLMELQRRTQAEIVRASAGEKSRIRALFEFFGRAA
jgi:hypothetical protein